MDDNRMETIFEDNFITSSDMLEENDTHSPIKDYLKDKTVFLTGGLGFIGKLLVEKLLRCDVNKIYLLARPKKGKSLEERFEKLINGPIFAKLLKHNPKPFTKIHLIAGDLQKIDLGISAEDRKKIINEVEVVYHAAADVRFDESLREATEINIRGTREIMLLSQNIENLNVFIYVSTAFCTPSFYVHETFYKTHLDPDFMIKLVEKLRPEDYGNFETVARRLIQPYPNTYTYSKALSEHIVRKYGENLNVAIIRPSIITTTWSDPLPGYTDNLYGVNGVVTGAGTGVLRILHINNDLKANIIPADFVINAILGLSWFTAADKNFNFAKPRTISSPNGAISDKEYFYHDYSSEKIKIYHCTISNSNPVTWRDVKEKTSVIGNKYPMKKNLWIIRYNTTKYYYLSQILKIFYHFLPALIIDTFLKYNNKTPKLLKIYRKVNKFSDVLTFFTTNEWSFKNDNMKKMCEAMSPYDKKFFLCDVEKIEWWDFFRVICRGLRRFICNEDLDTLEEARKRYRRMTIMHYIMMTVIYTLLAYVSFIIMKFYGITNVADNFLYRTRAFIKHDE